MKKNAIRSVVAIGIGTALFIVLSYVSVPLGFIPNTYIQSRIALLSFMSAIFGPVVGGAIGLLGHALADAIQYGGVWWSWVLADALYGALIGILASKYNIEQGGFQKKQIIIFNITQIIANAIAWIGLAPVLDIVIYAEPQNKVFVQGAGSFVANIISVGVIGTILAIAYSRVKSKSSSLIRED